MPTEPILSKNRRNDLVKEKRTYHRHQVQHYWIIDPIEETLAVHCWQSDGYVEVLIAERQVAVRTEPFDAIEFRVGVLFGDDDDDVGSRALVVPSPRAYVCWNRTSQAAAIARTRTSTKIAGTLRDGRLIDPGRRGRSGRARVLGSRRATRSFTERFKFVRVAGSGLYQLERTLAVWQLGCVATARPTELS